MMVFMCMAMTLCGHTAPAGFGSAADRLRLEYLRIRTDASLMGAGTLRQADPEMRGVGGQIPPARIRAIISRSGRIPFTGKKIFSHEPKPVVFTSVRHVTYLQERLAAKGQVVGVGEIANDLDLREVLAELEKRGVRSLLVEGGAILNYSCLRQQIVDEIFLTVTPHISGDRTAPGLADGPEPLGSPFFGLELLSCEAMHTGELFLHYKVLDRR